MRVQELKEKMSHLTELTGLVDYYLEKAQTLPKKDKIFIVADMDDTLISRQPLTDGEEILKIHRGDAGNKVVINDFGIFSIVKKYYRGKNPPKDIQNILRDSQNDALILTAGVVEFATEKAAGENLLDIPFAVVAHAKDKILKLVQYVVFTLQYIPGEIIIYEDRPNYFIEYKDLIERLLGTKVRVMYVEMNGNESYTKIEEIHGKI